MKTSYYERKHGRYPAQTWMVNYDAGRALANYVFLCAQMQSFDAPASPRIFASRECAAIIITNTSLDAIRDPHVAAWRESFFELDHAEFLARVEECLAGRRRYVGANLDQAA